MLEQQVLEQVLEHLRPETAKTAAKVRLLRCRPRAGTGVPWTVSTLRTYSPKQNNFVKPSLVASSLEERTAESTQKKDKRERLGEGRRKSPTTIVPSMCDAL